MTMSYVKLFADTSVAIDLLSDTEAGRLFKAVMHYINGVNDELPGQEKLIFSMLKAQFERDAEAYENYCDRQRENGKKGGRPRKPNGFDENPEKPMVIYETQKSQDKEKDKEKDKDKDKRGSVRATRFTAPTLDEGKAYAEEKGYTGFNSEKFIAYYESNGWRVGRNPMKDWRAAVRGWASRDKEQPAGRTKEWKNPALAYQQREYTDDMFGDDFYFNVVEEYGDKKKDKADDQYDGYIDLDSYGEAK